MKDSEHFQQAEIFVPEVCPPVKVERLRNYGADVTMVGAAYAEAIIASQARAAQTWILLL